jgi:hypothetical protein
VTTQLTDRLRDLADEAPAPLAVAGMWQEGRRRHRRSVARAVAVVGCLVASTAAVGIGGWRSTQPDPSAPPATRSGPMQIPDELFNPSPWTPSTRTPGRLVAVFGATRDHFPFGSDRTAVVGVAAGSQTYRFLDLPGQDPDATDVQLSPDGRHLAYWVPRRSGEQGRSAFAVLDLVTGTVERHVIVPNHAQYGLDVQSFTWTDSDSLALVGQRFSSRGPNSESGRSRTYLFALGDPSGYVVLGGRAEGLPRADVVNIPVTTQPQQVCAPTCPGLYAEMVGNRRLRVFTPSENSSASDVRLSAPVKSLVYDARRHLVAATEGNIDTDPPAAGPLMVGRVHDGRVRFTSVPGGRSYYQVVAWVDSSHVATYRLTRDGIVYDVVDVRTGERRQLTSKPWYSYTVARDALQHATTVPGIAPPRPWNPRWMAGGALALVVAGGLVVLLWKRRRVHG